MAKQVSVFLAGLVVGLLVAGSAVYVTPLPQSSVAVPSMTTTTATGCADADAPRVWVGQTPTSEYRSVVFQNYTFTHDDPDLEIRANLSETVDGRWVLAFTTRPETPSKPADPDCVPRTIVSSSVALPPDYETLDIRLDGETITTVQNSDKPRFHYLNETAS